MKEKPKPQQPDRLKDPELPVIRGSFAPNLLEQRVHPEPIGPDMVEPKAENQLEQL